MGIEVRLPPPTPVVRLRAVVRSGLGTRGDSEASSRQLVSALPEPNASGGSSLAETFTRAWAALPRYRRTGAPFVAWLYGIAGHVVADMAGSAHRVESRPEVAQRPHDPWPGGDDRLVLAAALAQLPEEQRRVIELKFLVGLTNAEVGVVLAKKPGAVNAQQWRALRALQRILASS